MAGGACAGRHGLGGGAGFSSCGTGSPSHEGTGHVHPSVTAYRAPPQTRPGRRCTLVLLKLSFRVLLKVLSLVSHSNASPTGLDGHLGPHGWPLTAPGTGDSCLSPLFPSPVGAWPPPSSLCSASLQTLPPPPPASVPAPLPTSSPGHSLRRKETSEPPDSVPRPPTWHLPSCYCRYRRRPGRALRPAVCTLIPGLTSPPRMRTVTRLRPLCVGTNAHLFRREWLHLLSVLGDRPRSSCRTVPGPGRTKRATASPL